MGCSSIINDQDLIELGFCTKAHGVKGGVTFNLSNPEESILKKNQEIKIFPMKPESEVPKDGLVIKIKSISFGNKVITYLEGVEDKNKVDTLVPFKIFAKRSDFPKIDNEDEFYVNDLVGLSCYHFETGDYVGEIKSTYDNGFQTILVIKTDDVTWDLPFVEAFFKNIDIDKGEISILPPQVV